MVVTTTVKLTEENGTKYVPMRMTIDSTVAMQILAEEFTRLKHKIAGLKGRCAKLKFQQENKLDNKWWFDDAIKGCERKLTAAYVLMQCCKEKMKGLEGETIMEIDLT